MATAYSWVISGLNCYPQNNGKTDVVFCINWRRQAVDGDYTTDVYGSQGVTLDPDAPFTPYDQLTEAQVTNWLETALGAEQIADLDAVLDQQIANQINPPVVSPALPWA